MSLVSWTAGKFSVVGQACLESIMLCRALLVSSLLTLAALAQPTPSNPASEDPPATRLKPVASTGSGLLLDVPLDLSRYTRAEFDADSATIGPSRIRRPWTSAITPLPIPPHSEGRSLTEAEVQATMLRMRDLFNAGQSVPISDVGLISTQEDVNRKPMLNHVAAFANASTHAYLLVQRLAGEPHWGYFGIVQDLAAEPPVDYFGEIQPRRVKFEGANCYKCHSSGPLAIHPAREDLVSDVPLLRAINRQIADQPPSRFHFPASDPAADYGEPLKLEACARCHAPDGPRAPLYRVHAHPIRILTDFGHMPPNKSLDQRELIDLREWLNKTH